MAHKLFIGGLSFSTSSERLFHAPSGRHPPLETQSGPTTTGPSEVVAPVLSVFSASSGRPEERDDERTREDVM